MKLRQKNKRTDIDFVLLFFCLNHVGLISPDLFPYI